MQCILLTVFIVFYSSQFCFVSWRTIIVFGFHKSTIRCFHGFHSNHRHTNSIDVYVAGNPIFAPVSPYNHDIEFHHTPFTSFQPITTDYLLSAITKCAPKSCELDPILRHFFCSVWMQYSQP